MKGTVEERSWVRTSDSSVDREILCPKVQVKDRIIEIVKGVDFFHVIRQK